MAAIIFRCNPTVTTIGAILLATSKGTKGRARVDVKVPCLVVESSLRSIETLSETSFNIPALGITGGMAAGGTGCDVYIPTFSTSGEFRVAADMTCEIPLPMLSMAASAGAINKSYIDVAVPMFTIESTLGMRPEFEILLPTLSVTSEINDMKVLAGEVSLPALSLAASSSPREVSDFDIALPCLSLASVQNYPDGYGTEMVLNALILHINSYTRLDNVLELTIKPFSIESSIDHVYDYTADIHLSPLVVRGKYAA